MTIIRPVRWAMDANPAHRAFVARRLLALKDALKSEIQGATDERSLRLATWNLMHFGDGGAYTRTTESMLYIAEIIDHFDLVAVQEVNEDLTQLEDLVKSYLGAGWDYIVTDMVEGTAGNYERLAFLYRTGKVQFCREAGEIVLPTGQEIAAPGSTGTTGHVQFARTPFSVSFRAGWLRFKLCTVHIHYGRDQSEGSPDLIRRRAEIQAIANLLAGRQDKESRDATARARARGWKAPEEAGWNANYLLLGDFNIISPEHETMQALTEAGFNVLDKGQADLAGSGHHYDQIACRTAHPGFTVRNSGVFAMFDHVYRTADIDHYLDEAHLDAVWERLNPDAGQEPRRTREQAAQYFTRYYRKHQMSDHELLWAELGIDYARDYLERIIAEE